MMNIEKIITAIENSPHYQGQICYRRHLPGQAAHFAIPAQWPPLAVRDYLDRMGIDRLYTHQAQAFDAVQRKEEHHDTEREAGAVLLLPV